MRVLNVGGARVPMGEEYAGWDVDLLDIDPEVRPDICMDAKQMTMLAPGRYEAVYASHVLEHFAEHEVGKVLRGFHHVLTADGFADVRVPDIMAVIGAVLRNGLELDSVLYQSPAGPIRVSDVLWGFQTQFARSWADFYTHRWGFSRNTLGRALHAARFEHILIGGGNYELRAMAFKRKPDRERMVSLGMVTDEK